MTPATKERTAQLSTTPTDENAPDPSAPSANSLAAILRQYTVPRLRYWSKRWNLWVHLRGMNAGEKEQWLADVIIEGADGKTRTVSTGLRQAAIQRCWVTENDELIAVGEEGLNALNQLHPEDLAELWDHVAKLNNLRDEDSAALKNGSGATTGSATSPAAPASTA